jgi:hypothetical protein
MEKERVHLWRTQRTAEYVIRYSHIKIWLANCPSEIGFDLQLEHGRKRGWIKAQGKQRTDSTHALAAIRTIRRPECVGETMRHALNILAEVAPNWLLEHMDAEWARRYEKRFSDFRLPKDMTWLSVQLDYRLSFSRDITANSADNSLSLVQNSTNKIGPNFIFY